MYDKFSVIFAVAIIWLRSRLVLIRSTAASLPPHFTGLNVHVETV